MANAETKRARLWRSTEAVLAPIRIVTGGIMIAHGWQKLTAVDATIQQFGNMGVPLPELSTWLAIAGELLGGLGLLLGLFTRLSALGPLLVTASAIVLVHWENGLFARNGGVELPLSLLMLSLVFVVHGGTPFSLDALLFHRRRRSARSADERTERRDYRDDDREYAQARERDYDKARPYDRDRAFDRDAERSHDRDLDRNQGPSERVVVTRGGTTGTPGLGPDVEPVRGERADEPRIRSRRDDRDEPRTTH